MDSKKFIVSHFYSEPIKVEFSSQATRKKSPPCPSSFTWQEQKFHITKCLSEWKDFGRRGRMAHNMQPQHAEMASQRGSWGVGRFYFEVETKSGQFFRIYYDRAPKNAFDRNGQWVLLAELTSKED